MASTGCLSGYEPHGNVLRPDLSEEGLFPGQVHPQPAATLSAPASSPPMLGGSTQDMMPPGHPQRTAAAALGMAVQVAQAAAPAVSQIAPTLPLGRRGNAYADLLVAHQAVE